MYSNWGIPVGFAICGRFPNVYTAIQVMNNKIDYFVADSINGNAFASVWPIRTAVEYLKVSQYNIASICIEGDGELSFN